MSSSFTAKMSACVTTVFLLLAMATITFCLHELESTLQMVQTQVVQARHWVQSSARLDGLEGVGVALSDCDKLYGESESRLAQLLANENHTRDDARTWLSSVLANHRTCLDALGEKGFVEIHAVAQNLTFWPREALAFYGKGRGTKKGKLPSFSFFFLSCF